MTSGKAALISALIGMGVGPGDEVIVPAYTYIATAIAVTATGAIPVIADCDETLTIDPEDIEMLSDLVIAAVNEAIRKAVDTSEQEMGKLTGGMNLPGLF